MVVLVFMLAFVSKKFVALRRAKKMRSKFSGLFRLICSIVKRLARFACSPGQARLQLLVLQQFDFRKVQQQRCGQQPSAVVAEEAVSSRVDLEEEFFARYQPLG